MTWPRTRWLLAGWLLVVSGCSEPPAPAPRPPCPKSDAWIAGVGVSLAGGEFGVESPLFSNRNPGQYGRDYFFNGPKVMAYFADRDIRLFRVPFRWERIQPRLGEPLDVEELKRLSDTVARAARHDGMVLLDLHNYGRYRLQQGDNVREVVVGQASSDGTVAVSKEHLADCWRRLAREFCGDPTVVAYGIMNEPYAMEPSPDRWQDISRHVVTAVRDVDPYTHILVSGDHWAHADRFDAINGETPWIDPTVANIVYEAHCYLDHDRSGQYKYDYDEELARDPDLADRGTRRVRAFVEWCRRNEARGYVGEFGVPGTDPRWIPLMRECLEYLDEHDVGVCYWAAGAWWDGYPLSIHPQGDASTPAPQIEVLDELVKNRRAADSGG